jgi:hypothetical protein
VIRFSAILIAAAIAVLVTGVLATNLALVYLSIVASVLAAALLAVGVLLRREEIFGDAGRARAVRQPAQPLPGGAGAPVMVGGRARILRPGGRAAESPAVIANGDAGAEPGQDARSGTRKPIRGKSAPDQAGAAKTGSAKPGSAKAGPGRAGGRIASGYSGTHGRGRSTTAPPGRRGATAPPAGTGARGAGGPGPTGSAPGDAGPPRVGTSASDLAGGSPDLPGGAPDLPGGAPDRAGGPADRAGRPSTDQAGTSSPDRAGGAPDRAGSPPDWAKTSSAPQASNGQPESAGPRPPSGRAKDAAPPSPPGLPPASPVPGRPPAPAPSSGVHDDFWDRVSEELDASTQRAPAAPPWAATAGYRAMGADHTDAPDDAAPHDAAPADEAGPGYGRAETKAAPSMEGQRWTAWSPAGSDRTGASSAGDVPGPADAGAPDEAAAPGGPAVGSHDSVPDVEEKEEEEEAVPSPWSIPLSFVGDRDDLEDEDVWHAPAADTANDTEQPEADDHLGADGEDADRPGKPQREDEVPSPARLDPVAEGPGGPDQAQDVSASGSAAEPSAASSSSGLSGSGAAAGLPTASSAPGSSASRPVAEAPEADASDASAGAADDTKSTDGGAAAPSASATTPADRDHLPAPEPDPSSSANGDHRPDAAGRPASPAGGDRQPLDEEVTIVPGVARYHRSGCILIRFLGDDDLETSSRREAKAAGCIACRACEPDKPLSADSQ